MRQRQSLVQLSERQRQLRIVESTAGVGVGGKSGIASVVTAGFFLLALFFSPLLAVITVEVTAPALSYRRCHDGFST